MNIKDLLKVKFIQNSVWLFVLQGVNTILPLLTIPYMTRILSVSQYGYFSIGLNWIGYLQVLVEFGFGLSASRKIAITNDEDDNIIFTNIVLSRLILAGISFIMLIILINICGFNEEINICMVILFSMAIGTIFQFNWFFQGKEDMKYITIGNVLGRTISTSLIFLLVKDSGDLFLYSFLYSLNFLLMGIFGFTLLKIKYKIKFVKTTLSNVISEIKSGWYVFISKAITSIFSGIGITYLGLIATSEEVGMYSAIFKIPTVLTLAWSPISQGIYPYISKKFCLSFKKGIEYIKRISKYILGVYGIIGVVIIVLREQIVYWFLGPNYVTYSMLVVPFVIWILVGIVNNLMGIQTLVGSGYDKDYSKCFTLSFIVSVICIMVLGKFFLAYGIAYASLISELFLTFLLVIKIRKINKEV